jgi:AraC family transcriptional regulator, positive regulator of tynA and feaB
VSVDVVPNLVCLRWQQELNISVRTLHRGARLRGRNVRAVVATSETSCRVALLESPLLKLMTVAEIGRRAGFSDPSHFTRVVRQRTGQTPRHRRVSIPEQ